MPESISGHSKGDCLSTLWDGFVVSRDQALRSELIEKYLYHARRIASHTYKMRPDDSVAYDDYLQYARIGLIECIDRFDPGSKVPFEAYSFRRIRGAILNGLQVESERSAQRKAGLQQVMIERLQSFETESQLSSEGDDIDQWINKVVGIALGLVLDVEDLGVASNLSCPYANVELLHLRRAIIDALNQLPARESETIRLHYFEAIEFQKIADSFGVTKGRVSQLHSSALKRLRLLVGSANRLDRSL